MARWGESLAADFLVARGATFVDRNVWAGRGEVDLLVRWDRKLVAVEVKTRLGADPRLAFTFDKARKVRDTMRLLSPRPSRLDLVAVEVGRAGAEVRWIPGV
ncbi:MAG: YraN family protein [Acidimicrobiia bacterium]